MPWEKGQSGNPGGRPKHEKEFREALKGKKDELLSRLDALSQDADGRVAVGAIKLMLEYGFGKPSTLKHGLERDKIKAEIALLEAELKSKTDGSTGREPIEIVVREYKETDKP